MFKGISPADIELLLSSVPHQIKKHSKDSYIALRTERCTNLMIVIKGSLRGEMVDYSGKLLKVADIETQQPVAPSFLYGENNWYPVDVIANNDVTLLYLPKDSIIKLSQKNETFLRNYLNAISNRTQFFSQRIWFLSFKTIKGKLAQYILDHLKDNMKSIELPMSQKELAEYFGVTRPSLARAISFMEKENIIDVKTRTFTIINKEKLVEIIDKE